MSTDAIYIHPAALCETENVGAGTRIWAFAHLLPGAIVGAGCNICDHVFIESGARVGDRVTVKNNVLLWDGVVIEDDVFLGPNAVFTNDLVPRAWNKKSSADLQRTLVRRGATIGANATIICDLTIGEGAFVAAGAVVIEDVPARALVAGNPARRIGWICDCGERLGPELHCECDRAYRLEDDRSGLALITDPSSTSLTHVTQLEV